MRSCNQAPQYAADTRLGQDAAVLTAGSRSSWLSENRSCCSGRTQSREDAGALTTELEDCAVWSARFNLCTEKPTTGAIESRLLIDSRAANAVGVPAASK